MRKNWAVRILVLLASVSLVLGGISLLSARRPYWSGAELPGRISTPSPASRSARNILVAGVEETDGAALAEMVLLINLDTETGKAGVMYLPGNTLVGADEVRYGRLSGALNWGTTDETGGGAAALADCIADCFVLPVDNYFLFDVSVLPDIAERLGGVRLSLENELQVSEEETMEAGEHIFHADDVKNYIISPDISSDETVSLLRAAFMEGMVKAFLGMPEKEAAALIKENKKSIDCDFSVREIRKLSDRLYEKSSSMIDYFVLPGRMVYGYGSSRLTVWSVRRAEAASLINDRMRAYTDHVLAEDMSLPGTIMQGSRRGRYGRNAVARWSEMIQDCSWMLWAGNPVSSRRDTRDRTVTAEPISINFLLNSKGSPERKGPPDLPCRCATSTKKGMS